ncbi:unnamed protein product [Lactuca saligna]|uniref:Fucosyltransferase n=1 Tax=Lactuca saligna TaxID=75948 RepID=A0AA36E8V8_LACSI|nr:unnamed protein product [Lactuca saligna]
MGSLNPNQRVSRGMQEDTYGPSSSNSTNTSTSSSSPPSTNVHNSDNSKKKLTNFLPLFLTLVFIVEIGFLARLDLIKNPDLVNSWAESFLQFTNSSFSSLSLDPVDEVAVADLSAAVVDVSRSVGGESCEEWLEREDSVVYSRDFRKEPVLISGREEDWKSCSVGCKFSLRKKKKKADASFGLHQEEGTAAILLSMESSHYFPRNEISKARGAGYDIIMTTSLSSDVPVGYFSWAEYDIMAPVQPKTEKALAAAFISNCASRNFRLQALKGLEKSNIKIDSYGSCHGNHNGNVEKVETLKRYKFSLAFENSNEEDYVTEKFFQSLVAGTIPVVVGAPNIQDFAPSTNSVLHIKKLTDVILVAKTMKQLSENLTAYNESLRWKYDGPSDSFKALLDMAAVHSSCRLCILVATRIHEREEKSPKFPKRPCKCTRGLETVYHVYVRERGRFEMQSIFLRSGNLTIEALESGVLSKFKSTEHESIWRKERPEGIRGNEKELKIYRIYPVGMTQRQALYAFSFKGNNNLFTSHIMSNPCAKFEIVFV